MQVAPRHHLKATGIAVSQAPFKSAQSHQTVPTVVLKPAEARLVLLRMLILAIKRRANYPRRASSVEMSWEVVQVEVEE